MNYEVRSAAPRERRRYTVVDPDGHYVPAASGFGSAVSGPSPSDRGGPLAAGQLELAATAAGLAGGAAGSSQPHLIGPSAQQGE